MRSRRVLFVCLFAAFALSALGASAQELSMSPNDVSFKLSLEGGNFSKAVNIFLLMTALSLVPSIIMMMTSFLRINIVLGFFRQALGTQNVPSQRTVTALSLFLTIFIMQPVWLDIYNNSIKPYSDGQVNEMVAIDKATEPIKEFMLRQTRDSSLLLFMELGGVEPVESPNDLSMAIVIPAFMLSELKTAFQMGFLIYLPFLVIDIVVSTVLMSMGMMMLPPMMISLPFKLLLFIIVDGWELLVKSLVNSFS